MNRSTYYIYYISLFVSIIPIDKIYLRLRFIYIISFLFHRIIYTLLWLIWLISFDLFVSAPLVLLSHALFTNPIIFILGFEHMKLKIYHFIRNKIPLQNESKCFLLQRQRMPLRSWNSSDIGSMWRGTRWEGLAKRWDNREVPFRVGKELGNNGARGPLWSNWCRYC